MVTQQGVSLVPVPPAAPDSAAFARLVAETAECARRQDLEADLAELAKPKLAEWMREYSPSLKRDLDGFLRIRLADLLLSTLRESEGVDAAAIVAMDIHARTLRTMAALMAKEHRLPQTAADDLHNRGRLAMLELMGSLDLQRNSSFHGYAFSRGMPQRARQIMMKGLCELLGLTEHQYRKACEVRRLEEKLFKANHRNPTFEELAEALGVKGFETAKRYLEYKAIAFDGFGRPCDDAVGADREAIDAEDRGKYGEAEAEDPFAKGLRKGEIVFCWQLLKIAKPKMAAAIFSKAMLAGSYDDVDASGGRAKDDSARQNLCRGRKLFLDIYRQLDADDSLAALADMLGIPCERVAQTYKDCVGF